MQINVYGSGCASCKKLHETVKQAARELGADAEVNYITDMKQIMKTGLMRMPGLMINGKMKAAGRVPSLKEVRQMISDELA